MADVVPLDPDIPGRGMWTAKGGLLGRGSGWVSGKFCYRMADTDAGEELIGKGWAEGSSAEFSDGVVYLGVKAWQGAFGMPYHDRRGVFGGKTASAGSAWLREHEMIDDGLFDAAVARVAFLPPMRRAADTHGVPRSLLYGLVEQESRWDPAAVDESGWRYGLCGISLHPKFGFGTALSLAQALTPDIALAHTASRLASNYQRIYTQTRGIQISKAWSVAILMHRSADWASVYRYGSVEDLVPEAKKYLNGVMVSEGAA